MGGHWIAEVEQRIAAQPQDVYDLVAGMTRMGEWSPECRSVEWIDDARFRGTNERDGFSWTTTCDVVVADRGREFAFAVERPNDGEPGVTWRYLFEPDPSGTIVRERFEMTRVPAALLARMADAPEEAKRAAVDARVAELKAAMASTLDRLKAAAETPGS